MGKNNTAELLYELQSEGHRLTKVRSALIDIFSMRLQPLLLEEVQDFLKKRRIPVHRATLYREIDFLKEKNIIAPVTLADNRIRYEFADRPHHHHAVCTKCQKIEEVEVEEDLTRHEQLLKKQKNFTLINHALEFFGVCSECQNV